MSSQVVQPQENREKRKRRASQEEVKADPLFDGKTKRKVKQLQKTPKTGRPFKGEVQEADG